MTTPYFYVLKEIPTGMLYAGVKFAKNCSPSDLLVTYLTSSKIVKALLAADPSCFAIERIRTFSSKEDAINYEKKFLKKVKADKSSRWYNQSISGAVSPDLLRHVYNQKYNVDNPKQLQSVKDKAAKTCMKKFNAPSRFEAEDFEDQRKQAMLSRYGVEYTTQSPQLLEKIKQSYLNKYGVDNPSKIPKNRLFHARLMTEKNKKLQTCTYCGAVSNIGNHARWHGDNCRHNQLTPATV
jgi:predicted GIY-YIG superfamily endonuclease